MNGLSAYVMAPAELPLFDRYLIPLNSRGGAAIPIVARGEKVLREQIVGLPEDVGAVAAHAPTSGQIGATVDHPLHGPSLELFSDGEDQTMATQRSEAEAIHRLRMGGVVGMGGGGFPLHRKLAGSVHTLVINAAEAEQGVVADQTLMQYHWHDVQQALLTITEAIDFSTCILAVAAHMDISPKTPSHHVLREVPSSYALGAERQLLAELGLARLHAGQRPASTGIAVVNVATAVAAAAALEGRPTTQRLVSIGNAEHSYAAWARIGSRLEDIERACAQRTEHEIIRGGILMGSQATRDQVVTKTTNALYWREPRRRSATTRPCIWCDACAPICPAGLQPQLLLESLQTDRPRQAGKLGLEECLRCGLCDSVCPSHIELTQTFTEAQRQMREREHRHAQAEHAKRRFEARRARLARRASEEQDRHRELRDRRSIRQAIEQARSAGKK